MLFKFCYIGVTYELNEDDIWAPPFNQAPPIIGETKEGFFY